MHRKFGKKKDVIFIGALLGICLIVLGVWYFCRRETGSFCGGDEREKCMEPIPCHSRRL